MAAPRTPHMGLAPRGTIPSGLDTKIPMPLPDEFYNPPGGRGIRKAPYMPPSQFERRQLDQNPELFGRPVAGLLHSDVPGRTDQLPTSVEPGSYVIPADVVSGLGQGNTMAGGTLFARMFGTQHKAKGGSVVPIVAAGGEYIVPPDVIKRRWGDLKKGHNALDKMVRKVRISVAKQMLKLPGPRRD